MDIDSVSSRRVLSSLLCAVIGLAGCEGASDLIWIQQKTIPMNGADFERCVTAALGEVSGVSVNPTQSTDFNISLNVKLTKPIPFLGVDVQHKADDTAEILFTGKGAHESDEERAAITPLLEAIAAAISNECARGGGMILALKEVSSFEAREINSSPMTIRLSGLAFHSAMVVRNISSVRDGDALQVLVHLMPTRPGYSGSFSYDLVIPDSINTVSFGNEKALVWDRSVGIVKPK